MKRKKPVVLFELRDERYFNPATRERSVTLCVAYTLEEAKRDKRTMFPSAMIVKSERGSDGIYYTVGEDGIVG